MRMMHVMRVMHVVRVMRVIHVMRVMHVMQRKPNANIRRHQVTIFDYVGLVRSWILERDGCVSTVLPQAISEFLLGMVDASGKLACAH